MKRTIQFFFVLLFVAGCSTSKEKIVFSDENLQTRGTTQIAAPQPRQLAKPERFQVELAVFNYLLSRHFWDDGEYSAIFIQADDAEIKILSKKFPNHVPSIKPAYRAELRLGRTPLDMDTGRPAMILSVNVDEPNADDSVDALGKWFAGDAVTGFYTFELRKNNGEWEIESVK